MKIKGFLIAIWGVKTPLIIGLIALGGLNGRPAYSLPSDGAWDEWVDKVGDQYEKSQKQNEKSQNQNNQSNSSADQPSDTAVILHQCDEVAQYLATPKMTQCPEGKNCIGFAIKLSGVQIAGGATACRLEGSAGWSLPFTEGEIFQGVHKRGGGFDSLADASPFLDNKMITVTYDILDVSQFTGYAYFELVYSSLGQDEELRIYFTQLTVDDFEVDLDAIADANNNNNAGGGGGDAGGGGGAVNPFINPFKNPEIPNAFGNPLGGVNLQPPPDEPSCDETVDGGVMDVSCAPSENPPSDDPNDPNDPAGPVASAGSSASGVDPLDTPTLMIQGAACQMNPYASINFGFGWFALLGLMISSLFYRRFK